RRPAAARPHGRLRRGLDRKGETDSCRLTINLVTPHAAPLPPRRHPHHGGSTDRSTHGRFRASTQHHRTDDAHRTALPIRAPPPLRTGVGGAALLAAVRIEVRTQLPAPSR